MFRRRLFRTVFRSSHRSFGTTGNDPNPVLPLKIVQNPFVQKMLPVLGNAGYIMLASGFLMTDILWLRLLLMGGYSSLLCYHGFQLRPLRIPLMGSALFVVVNAVKGGQILRERFVSLTDEEEHIYTNHFEDSMSAFDFKKFMSHGKVITAEGRQQLVQKGEPADLVLIIDGFAEVSIGEGVTIQVNQSGLIGEVSFMNGGGASASCFTTPGCKYIVWKRGGFQQTLKDEAGIRKGLELKVGRELTRKLHCTTQQLVKDQDSVIALSGDTCKCGNILAVDSRFCRFCGTERKNLTE